MKRFVIGLASIGIMTAALGLLSCQLKSNAAPKLSTQQIASQTTKIAIPTAKCSSCAKHIKQAATSVDGVESVSVNTDDHIAEVKFVPTKTNVHAIELAIAKSGYTANSTVRDSSAYEALDDCCKQ